MYRLFCVALLFVFGCGSSPQPHLHTYRLITTYADTLVVHRMFMMSNDYWVTLYDANRRVAIQSDHVESITEVTQ